MSRVTLIQSPARYWYHLPSQIMSSSQNSQQVLGIPTSPPSATGTVTPETISDEVIERACKLLPKILPADGADNIREKLEMIWFAVRKTLHRTGNIQIKDRVRNEHEFEAYVKPGSEREEELIKSVRSMQNAQVPWRDLFENGTFISSF
jgi:hypothetical protein